MYTVSNLGRLSETEMEVMREVWGRPAPATTASLFAVFEERKGWKPSTFATILSRLLDKGFLNKQTQSGERAYLYSAALTLQDYQKHETRNLLQRLYGGKMKTLIATWVDDDGIVKEDIEDLRDWFNDMIGGE